MTTTTPTPTPAAPSAADIVTAIRATELAPADRVEILRALRETTPDIVPPDPLQKTRIRSAAGLSRDFVDAAISGLSASDVWQQSAATTGAEIGTHRDFEEQRPVFNELQTFTDILHNSLSYHHWQATAKSRAAYRAGKALGGDEGLVLQPHIQIMAAALPKRSRKTKKPSAKTPPAQTPAVATKPSTP